MILAIGGLGPLAPVGLGGFKTHPGSLNEFDVIVIHPKTPTKTHVKTVMYSCVAEKASRPHGIEAGDLIGFGRLGAGSVFPP